MKLHMIETFIRIAIFHFNKLDYLKEEALNLSSFSQDDYYFMNRLTSNENQ